MLIVALPLVRPLRVARSAKALHALAALRTMGVLARALLRHHGLHWTLLTGLVLLLGSAVAMTYFEQGADGSIDDFGTALWWALVTITTVGYGDTYPVTAAGKGIAVFLMVVGIALFGLVTATIAAFLVEQNKRAEPAASLDDVLAQLRRLEAELAALRSSLAAPASAPPAERAAEETPSPALPA